LVKSRPLIVAIIIIVILVFATLGVGIALLVPGGLWTGPSAPSRVAMSGNLTLTGQGTHPTTLVFIGSGRGNVTASLGADGLFSATLPNPGVYKVEVGWMGSYSWQRGNVTLGDEYAIDQKEGAASTLSQNLSADTPDSQIAVSGNVTSATNDGGSSSTLAGVTFVLPQQGLNFTASVSGDQYSVNLPNGANYQVLVDRASQAGSDASSGSCMSAVDLEPPVPTASAISENLSC
jgi:hypothetical protein